MDKLIQALVREVRMRDYAAGVTGFKGQHGVCSDIAEGLTANMRLRIKGWLAAELGICKPGSVLEDNYLDHQHSKAAEGFEDKPIRTPLEVENERLAERQQRPCQCGSGMPVMECNRRDPCCG